MKDAEFWLASYFLANQNATGTNAATYKGMEPISNAAKIVFAHESLFAYKMFVGSQSREPFNLKFSSCWLKCLLKAAKMAST